MTNDGRYLIAVLFTALVIIYKEHTLLHDCDISDMGHQP